MTIPRVKPSNWTTNDRLLRSEMTQLDKNASYLLDSRSGQTDTLKSHITFDGANNGSLTMDIGSDFVIEDPTGIDIWDGYFKSKAQLIGVNSPLRHGYISETLPTSGAYTLPSLASLSAMHIRLTGVITGTVTVTMSDAAGYEKFFESAFTAPYGHKVILTTGSGNTVSLTAGNNSLIYCDGLNIVEVANTGYAKLVNEVSIKLDPLNFFPPSPTPGALVPEHTYPQYVGGNGSGAIIVNSNPTLISGDIGDDGLGFTNLTTPGKIVFMDGQAGDKFEITLSCGVQRTTGASNTISWIAPYVVSGAGWYWSNNQYYGPINHPQYAILSEAMIPAANGDYKFGSGKTIFTAAYDGVYEFKTFMYYYLPSVFYAFPVVGFGPLSYQVKQWRF